jgi:hypothetical protein
MADFDLSNYAPVDNTGSMRNIFKSGFKNVKFQVQPSTTLVITAKHLCNLPGIAYTYYQDTSLWRALLAYNGVVDALSDICVGFTLRIPSKSDLMAYINSQQSTSAPTFTL